MKGRITVTKISAINENAAIQPKQRPSSPLVEEFQDSLDMALTRKTGGATEGEQTSPLSEPQSIHINQAFAPATAEDVIGQTDDLLELLESYANGLENPKATMKDLASLVDQIKDGADKLMASAKESPSEANDLKEIATQTALTAATEYIKFQRGDYV
jgi:methyl-accepting chemotaxis protein